MPCAAGHVATPGRCRGTGTGPRGIANDVAVIWPTGRAPLYVPGDYQGGKGANGHRDAVLAEVGRVAAAF